MSAIKATYRRQLEANGIWLGQEPIELEAHCEQMGDIVIVAFTAETLELLASLDLTVAQLEGCDEAVEEAFFQAEREACRVSSLRQRTEAA